MNNSRIATPDAIKYNKDCRDFVCLEDGTITKECKYCNLSKLCQQVDLVNGKPIPMENHFLPEVDPLTNETIGWEYYCTGKYDRRILSERIEGDEKVS